MGLSSKAPMNYSARIQDSEYLYASNTNVSNFVSVTLSGNHNYFLWKEQMLCLLDSNNMRGLVEATFVGPRDSGTETMRQYDSLVKGWIFGSVSEDVLEVVFNLRSAKDVWETLKSIYDPTMPLRNESNIIQEDTHNKNEDKKRLRAATIKGDWSEVERILIEDVGLVKEAISSDGSTILHIAVGIGHNDFVKNLFLYINDEQVRQQRDSDGSTELHIVVGIGHNDFVLQQRENDGSTALHIAAIVGNKDGVELLVKTNRNLLQIKNNDGEVPLQKAYENMHLDTIGYLLKAARDTVGYPGDDLAVKLLVNAISAKQYCLALDFVDKFPESASKTDEVLVAIAKTFPTGPDYWETLVYPPSLRSMGARIKEEASYTGLIIIVLIVWPVLIWEMNKEQAFSIKDAAIVVPLVLLLFPFQFIYLLILIVCFPFLKLYSVWWNYTKILFPPIKHIDNKVKELDEAKKVLNLVCDEIDKLKHPRTNHPCYTQPILEAACQNAFEVVDEILFRSPEVIESTDKNGYDIIQLAIINRSEKIYNFIYDIGERKNVYRTYEDSSRNSILHLAGKLAPPSVLNKRTGAALQLQRELQWREEVKKFVFPTYITQENIFKQTPNMVFTREHKHLVKEGEQWMKTTAESCSITAALISTIVFAAAITVPGGSNQNDGTPLFKEEIPFIIFAISDAISLFASSTALLVFLSILTARFAENDFLVSLPRRLFIGLFFLLLSTTAMMVAFSATLFLVFCDGKLWMLAPICVLAFIPIAFFVGLQFPLMVDLFSSTYIRIFGKQRKSIFNKDDIRLLFGPNRREGKQDKQWRRVISKTLLRN